MVLSQILRPDCLQISPVRSGPSPIVRSGQSNYSIELYESAEYRKELPVLKEWCKKNGKLFEYLSDGLRIISLMTYVRYGGVRPYLQAHHNLQLLCSIWFRVVINEVVTSSTSTHLDFGDSGFNCVVP